MNIVTCGSECHLISLYVIFLGLEQVLFLFYGLIIYYSAKKYLSIKVCWKFQKFCFEMIAEVLNLVHRSSFVFL